MTTTPKLAISFSGGRTSALMTKLCFDKYGATHEINVTFANTGCEHPETYEFVEKCDKYFGFNVTWVEAEVNPQEGKGITHRIVNYDTASRDGRPYADFIKKYGIPNQGSPQCTTRLKIRPMESFLKTKGYRRGKKLNYDTAIGIRADEIDRVASNYKEERFIYPLIDAGITKPDVLAFWKKQPFDLKLPGEHLGNCTWCWKKSDRKLLTLMVDYPEVFDFPEKMEQLYGAHKARDGRRNFFRKHRSVEDLRILSRSPFSKFIDNNVIPFDKELDAGSACGESCEVGADEMGYLSLPD
jgi:hypothetical protein